MFARLSPRNIAAALLHTASKGFKPYLIQNNLTILRQDGYQYLSEINPISTKQDQEKCQPIIGLRQEQEAAGLRGASHQGSSEHAPGSCVWPRLSPGVWRPALPKDQGAGGEEQGAGGRGGPPGSEETQGQVHAHFGVQDCQCHQVRRRSGEGRHPSPDSHPKPDPNEAGGRGPCRRHLFLQPHLHRPAPIPSLQLPPQLLLLLGGGRYQVREEQRHRPVLQLRSDQKKGSHAVRGQEAQEGRQAPQVLHGLRRPDHRQEDPRSQEDQDLLGGQQEGLLHQDRHHLGAEGQVGPGVNFPFRYANFSFIYANRFVSYSMPIHKLAAALFGGSLSGFVIISNEQK